MQMPGGHDRFWDRVCSVNEACKVLPGLALVVQTQALPLLLVQACMAPAIECSGKVWVKGETGHYRQRNQKHLLAIEASTTSCDANP